MSDKPMLTWADYQTAFDAYAQTHLQARPGGRVAASRMRADFNHWLAVDRDWPPVVAFEMVRLIAGNPALSEATRGRGWVQLPGDGVDDNPLTAGGTSASVWRGIAMRAALTHP